MPAVAFLLSTGSGYAQSWSPSLSGCDAVAREHPDDPLSYRCHWFAARRLGNWAEAREHLARTLERRPDDHRARLSLALIEGDLGRNDEAFANFRRAREGFSDAGDARGEIYARQGHAFMLIHQGELDDAEGILRDGERVAERSGDDMLLATILCEQGMLAQRRGDYGLARSRFESARRRLDPTKPAFAFLDGRTLNGLAEVARAMAQPQEARELFEARADMLRDMGAHYEEMFARYDVAAMTDVLWRRGEVDAAVVQRLAAEVLEGSMDVGNDWTAAASRILLARFLDVADAERELERAAGFLVAGGHREYASRAYQQLARNAWRSGDLEAGHARAARALALAEESGDPVEIARSRLALAQIEWRRSPGQDARLAWKRALDAVESIRDLQPDGGVRAESFASWSFAYYQFAALLLESFEASGERADLELALEVGERRRSRVLLEQLDAAHVTSTLVPGGELAGAWDDLLRRIVEVQRGLLSPELDETARRSRLQGLEELEDRERRLRDAIARESDAFAAIRDPSFPSLEELHAAIDPEEALLSFHLPSLRDPSGELPEGFLQISTRSGTTFLELPSKDEIDPAVEMFLGLIQRGDDAELLGARRLYDLLLKSALERLPEEVTRLVLVPDGALHRLPFAALAASPGDARLFERFETSMVPSITAWVRWREQRPPRRKARALVLADPEPLATLREGGASEPAWAPAGGPSLGALPYARSEGRTVVDLLGARESRLLVGSDATERFVKDTDLSRFDILHFAAHGIVDATTPERSAILLSAGAAGEDGLLQLRDIVELDLSGKLVVLSACRSASGEVLAGEGVLGLGRAFFQAGAQSVVGSLWKLGDEQGAEAFETFYGALRNGESVAGAMREAQRELARAGAPAADWAGLVVLGDGGFAPIDAASSLSLPRAMRPLIGALALAGLALLGRRVGSRLSSEKANGGS